MALQKGDPLMRTYSVESARRPRNTGAFPTLGLAQGQRVSPCVFFRLGG